MEGKVTVSIPASLCIPHHTEGVGQNAPIPAGRSVISCKRLLCRLKEKHKEDIEKIKNGETINAAPGTANETTATPEKSKSPRKRKTKAVGDGEAGGDAKGSPKKKTGGRKKKADDVKEESVEDEVAA